MGFNNGSVIMAAFLTKLTNSTNTNKTTHVIYDTNIAADNYTANQTQHIKCLLENVSVNFTISHFFVVTWVSYGYCNQSEVSWIIFTYPHYIIINTMQEINFQLALASDSIKTYALFLYYGTDNNSSCDPLVATGFESGTMHNQINIAASTQNRNLVK